MARKATFLLCAVVLLVLLVLPAQAWWSKGHMSAAEIARRHMDPAILEKVERASRIHHLMGPYPKSPDFVQSASWHDDLKELGLNTMSTWHYINTPTLIEGDTYKLTVSPINKVNVVTVIDDQTSAIMKTTKSEIVVTSLAGLTHFIGDLHQPLHATNIFSSQYPNSDLGGNKQIVTVDDAGTTMTLHAFWDSIGEGQAGTDMERPLSNADYASLRAFVDHLEATWAPTLTDAEKAETNATIMQQESMALAQKYVYPGADNGAVLTAAYRAMAVNVTQRQVTLAGYRLAASLNAAFKGVTMALIEEAAKDVQSAVSTENHTYYHVLKENGISGGATAGIAVATFAVGCIFAAVIIASVFTCCKPAKGRYTSV